MAPPKRRDFTEAGDDLYLLSAACATSACGACTGVLSDGETCDHHCHGGLGLLALTSRALDVPRPVLDWQAAS